MVKQQKKVGPVIYISSSKVDIVDVLLNQLCKAFNKSPKAIIFAPVEMK